MVDPLFVLSPSGHGQCRGGGVAVADVTGSGRPDLIVFATDGPTGDEGRYCIGRDLDARGEVTGGWGAWETVPGWFSSDLHGAGVAVARLTAGRRRDMVVFAVLRRPGHTRGLYRIARDLDASGRPRGGWGPWTALGAGPGRPDPPADLLRDGTPLLAGGAATTRLARATTSRQCMAAPPTPARDDAGVTWGQEDAGIGRQLWARARRVLRASWPQLAIGLQAAGLVWIDPTLWRPDAGDTDHRDDPDDDS